MAKISKKTINNPNSIVWKYGDDFTPEVEYIIKNNFFNYSPKEFSIKGKNGWKIYPTNYQILFHNIEKDEDGNIKKLLFFFFEPSLNEEDIVNNQKEEREYLVEKYGLVINPDSDENYYFFEKMGLSFDKNTKFDFFDVKKVDGKIVYLNFHIILSKSKIWTRVQGTDFPEVKYMIEKYNLSIDPNNYNEMYKYHAGDKIVIYPENSRIVFHNITLNSEGKLVYLKFQFQKNIWV